MRPLQAPYIFVLPNHSLEWSIIRWGIECGLRTHDMAGVNIPCIAQFKRGFGRRFVPCVTFHRSYGWLACRGEYGYKILMPLAQRIASKFGK